MSNPNTSDDFGYDGWQEGDESARGEFDRLANPESAPFDPDTERAIDEQLIPVGKVPSSLAREVYGDIRLETEQRLRALGVDGVRRLSESQIRAMPELAMSPYILDDVHYDVYEGLRDRLVLNFLDNKRFANDSAIRMVPDPLGFYVTVEAQNIWDQFRKMKRDHITAQDVQFRQDTVANEYLVRQLKLDYNSISEVKVSSGGRFAVRSLYRLLRERPLLWLSEALPKQAAEHSEDLILFSDVATDAVRYMAWLRYELKRVNQSSLSRDQRAHYELIGRGYNRARAFAQSLKPYVDLSGLADPPSEESVIPKD
jgi:hypothetical protein